MPTRDQPTARATRHGNARVIAAVLASALTAAWISAAAPDEPSAPSAAGLVAAFAFEENVGTTTADASGGANTAQLVSAVWTTDGKFGNALVFNGTNARVTVIPTLSPCGSRRR